MRNTVFQRRWLAFLVIAAQFVGALGTNGMIDASTTPDPETLVINQFRDLTV